MKPKTIATREAVFEAANRLIDAGIYPSAPKVREAIGGGNLKTISKWLHAWHDLRQGQALPQATVVQPVPVYASHADVLRLEQAIQTLAGDLLKLEKIVVDVYTEVRHPKPQKACSWLTLALMIMAFIGGFCLGRL
jgi:hypothetical protein